jgi:hypothetical protein
MTNKPNRPEIVEVRTHREALAQVAQDIDQAFIDRMLLYIRLGIAGLVVAVAVIGALCGYLVNLINRL